MSPITFTKCPVLFEDADLLIIEKPEGVLSHPNPSVVIPERFNRESSSGSPLKSRGDDHQRKGPACALEGAYDLNERRFETPAGPVWLIHRLDQDTSGVLLAAKNKKSAEACRRAFDHRKVKKDYLALVSRRPMPPQGTWRDTLFERRTHGSIRVTAGGRGQPNAFLNYRLKEYFSKFNLSLLEIGLLSGKTHQVRVQTPYRGHPVAGDRIYGSFPLNKELKQALGLRRLFLHAWRLLLPHPSSGKLLTIESPLPADLEQTLVIATSHKKTS